MRFDLFINLNSARALRIKVPKSVLLKANEIIEQARSGACAGRVSHQPTSAESLQYLERRPLRKVECV